MKQKAFVLQNKGMNRDLSVSKAGESSAYENHNIRITARDHDTLLSVTNERGNKEISLGNFIVGTLIGWNVLNNHVILFTHQEPNIDRIYRIDYLGELFQMKAGSHIDVPLYTGNLGFDCEHPIESVVYFETEDIQKIYWVDGKNVLRFMNFMAKDAEIALWNTDNTSFDTNRPARFTVNVTVEKDNAGNARANGVVQYFLTYFNKHGQETGYAWASDLVYLSPVGIGGSADEQNTNRVLFEISNLDTRYTNFRLYSIFRSSYNGQVVSYLVHEGYTAGGTAKAVDDGAHLEVQDSTRLLFLGSRDVRPGTLAHKDQTLFLGDLQATVPNYGDLAAKIAATMFSSDFSWKTGAVSFHYSDDAEPEIKNIPLADTDGKYSYENQLVRSSSDILTFKGGEKYRFALVFRDANGNASKAFWIGDLVNDKYPVMDFQNNVIRRVIAKCTVDPLVLQAARSAGFETVQLMIAEATYADRSVKAQGILNPTMFNVWERYNDRLYSCPSWIFRPYNAGFAAEHFQVVANSTWSNGEIQCNYWDTGNTPAPYFKINNYATENPSYDEEFDGVSDYDYLMVVYSVGKGGGRISTSWGSVVAIKATLLSQTDAARTALLQHLFTEGQIGTPDSESDYTDSNNYYSLHIYRSKVYRYRGISKNSSDQILNSIVSYLYDTVELQADDASIIQDPDYFKEHVYDECSSHATVYYSPKLSSLDSTLLASLNKASAGSETPSSDRWYLITDATYSSSEYSDAAYYKKHLMFVDNNIVTLNSPEIEYEAVSFDNVSDYKLRIVGVAKVTDNLTDYTVVATHGKKPGDNLIHTSFSKKSGLLSWPFWSEYGLVEETKDDDNQEPEEDVKKRDSRDYDWSQEPVNYWLYMWQHAGSITCFSDASNQDYSRLQAKTFANLRYCGSTYYKNLDSEDITSREYSLDSLRLYDYLSSQYISIKVGNETKYYDGNVSLALSMPGEHKYPIVFSRSFPKTIEETHSDEAKLYSNIPIQIEFNSSAHAVLSLHTEANIVDTDYSENPIYLQEILPSVCGEGLVFNEDADANVTGRLIPWIDVDTTGTYPYKDYYLKQEDLLFNPIGEEDTFFLIGEIYYDFDNAQTDTRYGGTSEADLEKNRFIPAGPEAVIGNNSSLLLYGNQGDTYFQRWDCLKTKPIAAEGALNGVIDIASVMLETHINIDGRTDKQRGTKYLASINTAQWGTLNRVYSQDNNYFVRQVLDEDFDLSAYRSSITWTLQKADSADVDEWTHITLATHLKLDGDKGICRAIRRIQNSLISFQDRGIAEILFNSRTQLATTDGVPIEIANSGKVDGKRYITNKFGCLNKWSIVEGKNALYFVDNINKAFCAFNGNVQNLSTGLGFGVWFRAKNDINPWRPDEFNNFVSFYDRIHSDVYIVKATTNEEKDAPALIYNETLGVFTSFFDYGSVPMMTNVEDKFISFKSNRLWLQNEGAYCNFFGDQFDFWTQYRVTPEPYGDKVWTNVEYRADFYRVLSGQTNVVPIEPDFTDDLNLYRPEETFDYMRFWNEYQTTASKATYRCRPIKKFRIWRLAIPRAVKSTFNPNGLDRIRNPWLNLLFRKMYTSKDDPSTQDLMQLHDVIVIYYE